MSKLFFDNLLKSKKLEKRLKKVFSSIEEKEEIWHIIDEIIHHRVLECILDNLNEKHHKEFVVKLHSAPHDDDIWKYLREKISIDVENFIEKEIDSIIDEITKDLEAPKKK